MTGAVTPVAAIDCGTNSTRLLIADADANAGTDGRRRGSLSSLCRLMQITRLGQGVDATGRLDARAVERTLEVLRGFRTRMDDFGVQRARITATSAARDAANRDEFLEPAEQIIGVPVELLSGAEEAALSFAGATAELCDRPGRYLVVDIGGGSTEFAVGTVGQDGASLDGAESVDIGCVRITERYVTTDPPSTAELSSAGTYCDGVIRGVLDRVEGARRAGGVVGLAGTVSTLAAVDLGLESYDRDLVHHHVLTGSRVRELSRRLLAMSTGERSAVPGMEPARAEVIVGGLVILGSLFSQASIDELLVSEADILDGLAASLLG